MSRRAPLIICEDMHGREVRLEDETWYVKICVGHPELEPMLDQVEQAITSPDVLTADAHHSDRECYYLRHTARDRRPLLKVCVSFERGPEEGRIITAYLVTSIPTKEAILWQR